MNKSYIVNGGSETHFLLIRQLIYRNTLPLEYYHRYLSFRLIKKIKS